MHAAPAAEDDGNSPVAPNGERDALLTQLRTTVATGEGWDEIARPFGPRLRSMIQIRMQPRLRGRIDAEHCSAATSVALAASLIGKLTTPSAAAVMAELRLQLEAALNQLEDVDHGRGKHRLGLERGWTIDRQRRRLRSNIHPSCPDGELISVLDSSCIRAAFAHGGYLLATSGWEGTTELWDAVSGKKLGDAAGYALRLSQDGQQIGFYDNRGIGFWDVAPQVECRTIRPASLGRWQPIDHCMYSSDFGVGGAAAGQLATCGTSGVWLWNRLTGQELVHLECGSTRSALFRDDGRGLVSSFTMNGYYYWPLRREVTGGSDILKVGPPELLQELRQQDFSAVTGRPPSMP